MDYKKLTFTNNFIFCKVLENNLDLCRELLELILGIKIRKVKLADKEKVIDITSAGKSIRLDVYVEDNLNSVYDIEMQVSVKRNLPKRSRYYQGMLDLNSIEKGAKYKDLKKSYIIFICMFDPFDQGLPVYTFTNRCKEKIDLELGDEAMKVFVNPYGNTERLSEGIKAFFQYLKEGTVQSEFTERLGAEVDRVRESKEWRLEYMTWLSELEESKEEAREEGREEGRAQGREEGRAQGREEGRVQGREEGRTEGLEKGIEGMVEMAHEFGQSFEATRAIVIGKYPDVAQSFIDAIIRRIYGIQPV